MSLFNICSWQAYGRSWWIKSTKCADAIFDKEPIVVQSDKLPREFCYIKNQPIYSTTCKPVEFFKTADARFVDMEQKSIVQEESLEGVIKTVKDLIAQVESRIKACL